MKNHFIRSVLFGLVAVGLCFPTTVLAENRAGSFNISPMVGAHIFKESEGFQNSGFVGLNVGYNFTKNWGLEFVGTAADVKYEPEGTGEFRYWTGRVEGLYHFRPTEKFVPYIGAGIGAAFLSQNVPGDPVNEDVFLNYGLGFKYFTTDWLAFRFDARHAVRHEAEYAPTSHGKNYANFMFSGGLTFQMGGEKSAAAMQQADSDGDGVINSVDQCSGTPAGVAVDANGCPKDSDADGVIDAVDQCPDSLAGADVDAQGCAPVVVAVVMEDADSDGVADIDDKCPNTPVEVPVNERGCPADTDQDGVFDVDDQCPDTETGKKVDADGCEIDYAAMAELKLEITFASNSSVIDAKFNVQMQHAADFIKAHPGKKLIVEGYTDNTGSVAVNKRMSQKRADTVRWVLVRDYGVNKANLTAKGFGEANPIADNNTQLGRMANRRVVIKLVD